MSVNPRKATSVRLAPPIACHGRDDEPAEYVNARDQGILPRMSKRYSSRVPRATRHEVDSLYPGRFKPTGSDVFCISAPPMRMPLSSRFVVQSTIGPACRWLFDAPRHRRHDDLARRARADLFRRGRSRRATCAARGRAAQCALQTAESSQRGFIVTGNEIYLAPYGTAKAQAARQLRRSCERSRATPRSSR